MEPSEGTPPGQMPEPGSVALPSRWRTRTGPARWAYLGAFALFAAGLYAVFALGYAWQADRDDEAADFSRSAGEPLKFVVDQEGDWTVFLETRAGLELDDALETALRRHDNFGAVVTPASGGDPVSLRAAEYAPYRLSGDHQLNGHAIGQVHLEPGEYTVTVPGAAEGSSPAVIGFAVGSAPAPAPVWILLLAVGTTVTAVIAAVFVRKARQSARHRLIRPMGPVVATTEPPPPFRTPPPPPRPGGHP